MRDDNQTPALFGQTPWQTVGPFFHYCLPWLGGADRAGQSNHGGRPELLVPGQASLPRYRPPVIADGEWLALSGRVLDAAGAPVPDAMLEIWHADAAGNCHPAAGVFARCATTDAGYYHFTTVRPGAVCGDDGSVHAPQIHVGIFARGLMKRLVTRVFFADAPENAGDPLLQSLPAERMATLLAEQGTNGWQLDIVLSGPGETIFLQC